MQLADGEVDINEVYRSQDGDGGLYEPDTPANTLECLNGALDASNVESTFKIQPWMCQVGTFARGAYWGSDRWEFIQATQLDLDVTTASSDTTGNDRIILTTMSRRLFIPWPCRTIIWGFQGWFCQEATVWDTDGTPVEEQWDIMVRCSSAATALSERHGARTILPAGRGCDVVSTSGLTIPGGSIDPGEHREDRFRWVEKHGHSVLSSAGYFHFEVSVGNNIQANNYQDARLKIPSCAAWVLALR